MLKKCIIGLILICLLLVVGCASEENKKTTLGVTILDFTKSFNEFAPRYGLEYGLVSPQITEGKNGIVFQNMLTDNLGMAGLADLQSKEIKSISLAMRGDNTPESGLAMLGFMYATISGINPSWTPNEIQELTKKLGIVDGPFDPNKLNGNATIDGVSYKLKGPREIGVTLIIEVAK